MSTYLPIKDAFIEGRADEAATRTALGKYRMDGRNKIPQVTIDSMINQWKRAARHNAKARASTVQVSALKLVLDREIGKR